MLYIHLLWVYLCKEVSVCEDILGIQSHCLAASMDQNSSIMFHLGL